MAVNIHNLVAAISPDVYCDPSVRSEVKRIVKESGYLKAAEKAKPVNSDVPFNYDVSKRDPLSEWGLQAPVEKHSLEYDSATEGLEPVYFWILDFLNKAFKGVDKLIDNFASTPGSGHFSELGQKLTRMQDESMKLLGSVNTVLKSVLNLIYDLKEFKLRLEIYDKYKKGSGIEKSSALLSLKQIWVDSVDIKKGNSAIKVMAQQFDFVTILDAFMAASSLESIKYLDLNERVRRILEQRVSEFFRWIDESDSELRKRFEIEKKYLRSQVSALKLYARWIKPYLLATRKLENTEMTNAALVNAFNTIILELTLLAKASYDPEDDVKQGILPNSFKTMKLRKYVPIVIVEFSFRGIPQRVGQNYAFGVGLTKVNFTSYALNEDELKVLKDEMEKDNFGDVLSLIDGATSESIDLIQKDVDEFLESKRDKERKIDSADVNPFTALFSFLKTEKKDEKKPDLSRGIKSDSSHEKVVRSQAIIDARERCFTVFDTYKKAHGMPSHTSPYDNI